MNIPQTAFNALHSHVLAAKLWAFLDNAEPEELFPIDVYGLSDKWGAEKQQTLQLFLQGVGAGIFTFSWVDRCPECGGDISGQHIYIQMQKCPACGMEFIPYADIHRFAVFSIHPCVYEYNVPDAVITGGAEAGVRAMDCLLIPEFRCGHGWGLTPPGTAMSIHNGIVLLVSDARLNGLYETLDDIHAFAEGYRMLSDIAEYVRSSGGSVFRYANDSVAALFSDAVSAVKAAVLIHKSTQKRDDHSINDMIISLHAGPLLAVNYGEKVSFSGRVLADIAAVHTKIQHSHISVSDVVYNHPGVSAVLESYAKGIKRTKVVLKAARRELVIFRCI